MTERPILFSAPMVSAILAGRKTQTRRIVKPPIGWSSGHVHSSANGEWGLYLDRPHAGPYQHIGKCPFGVPGNHLWVREAWAPSEYSYEDRSVSDLPLNCQIAYLADGKLSGDRYRTSTHMPRWASRITLEITGVRVERLQEISYADAEAEGIEFSESSEQAREWREYSADDWTSCPIDSFASLWGKIHADDGPNGWAGNPWVWVIEFRRLEGGLA